MSKIDNICNKVMNKYSTDRKPQHWNKPEPPPLEPYSQGEVWTIVDTIAKEINSILADSLLTKE